MIARWAAAYVGAGLAMAALDAAWLATTSGPLYHAALGTVLAPAFRPAPATLFYLVYVLGVTLFAIDPAIHAGRWRDAATRGGLFGLFCYATYDLTNQATLIVWSSRITLIDIAWGALLTAIAATAGYFASKLARAGRA